MVEGDSFGKDSKLHSRRAARARQMRLMEEVASGCCSIDDANHDEDEGPPSIFIDAASHLWSSRTGQKELDSDELDFVLRRNDGTEADNAGDKASSSFLSRWMNRNDHEESRNLIMMSSRRMSDERSNTKISPFGNDSNEEDFAKNNMNQQRHIVVLPTWCFVHGKVILSLSIFAVLFLAISVAPTVLIDRNNSEDLKQEGGGKSRFPWNPSDEKDNPLDTERFDRIKSSILQRRISHAYELDDTSSPQYRALAWIASDDERHIDFPQIDDEDANMTDVETALLQRYALAVIWFQTTDTTVVEESLNITIENPSDIVWRNADGWMTPKGFCLWHGVTCHPHQNYGLKYDGDFHVAVLNLTANNIHGVLPDELFTAFLKLNVLDLSNNHLVGTIGRDLANLSELEDLLIGGNSFEGALPENIGELRNLKRIFANDNNFDGPIPVSIGELEHLQELGLFNNKFSGRIPPSIVMLKDLIALYLESNQLTGNVPSIIGLMTALEDIRLRNNKLDGPIPTELGNLKQLRTVYMDTNKLTGSIPTEIGQLAKLDDLHLYQNELKGRLPVELAFLSGLTTLYVDSNDLTGSIPEEFGEMYSLEELFISGNEMTGVLPATIRGMKSLRYLRVSDNQFEGKIPTDLGKLLKLEYLMLDANRFSGFPPKELGELKELKVG